MPIKQNKTARSVAFIGILAGVALVLGGLERLLPLPMLLPGMKLGFSNLVVVVALYVLGFRAAVAVSLIRLALGGFLFGSGFSILFALAGGLFSLLAMGLGKRSGLFSVVGVSVLGGVCHNIGQLLAAVFVTNSWYMAGYLPFLLLAGEGAGLAVGFAGLWVLKAMKKGMG